MPGVDSRSPFPSPSKDADLKLGDFDKSFTFSYDAVSGARQTSCHRRLSSTWHSTTTRQEREPSSLYPMPLAEIAIDVYPRQSLFAKRLLPNPTGTYWTSAANPVPDVCNFAIGASNGSFILRDINSRWFLERNPNLQGQGEAVAIDWLGPRVVLKGCGEGSVRLWDLRSRGEGTEPRIQHRTSINHLRRIDENMVVVAGLLNEVSNLRCACSTLGLTFQLCTYDLRYAKRISANGPTQHYDKFPTYRNTMLGHISTGLDVHRNLVAATTDDRRVQIFDVKKGVELVPGIRNLNANAASIKFVDEQRSGNGLKLLVASGPRIDSYGFEDSEQRCLWDRDEAHHCLWSRD